MAPKAMIARDESFVDKGCQGIFAGLFTIQGDQVLFRLPDCRFATFEEEVPAFGSIQPLLEKSDSVGGWFGGSAQRQVVEQCAGLSSRPSLASS